MSTKTAPPPGVATHAAGGSHAGWRTLALAAVVGGVLLLTAAACVLSYSGIHALARQAGASAQLARVYPVIFDAMAVVAGSAVLALRDAGLPSRCYAWLCLLLLLAGLAAGSAAHAAGLTIPHKPAEYTAAIVPWVLVLLGFGLLLALLRHARQRRPGRGAAGGRRRPGESVIPAVPAAIAADRDAATALEGGWTTAEPAAAAAGRGAEPDTTELPAAQLTTAGPATTAEPPTTAGPATTELPTRQPGSAWPAGRLASTPPVPEVSAAPQAELQLRATFPRRPASSETLTDTPAGLPVESGLSPENEPGDDGGAELNPAPVPAQYGPTDLSEERQGGPDSELAEAADPDQPGPEQADPPALDRPHSSPLPPVD